ncbi:MAG: RNA-binding S4 domain-containing protein [Culicoidibacterales bacterium]
MNKNFILREKSPFITMSQLLKMEGIAYSGGAVRFFLEDNEVLVNDEVELRRGRKLYPGDVIVIDEIIITVVGA